MANKPPQKQDGNPRQPNEPVRQRPAREDEYPVRDKEYKIHDEE